MSFKKTLVLFLVFVALAAYVYFGEIKKQAKEEVLKEKAQKVILFDKDSVNTLEIKNLYGHFVLKKEDKNWVITQPIRTEADQPVVVSMIGTLNRAKKQNEFTGSKDDWISYGFGTGAVIVKVKWDGAREDSVIMGDKTPVGAYVFATKGDSVVFTIGQHVKRAFDKKLFNLRDKKILHFKREDVKKVIVRNDHGLFKFVRKGEGWQMEDIDRPADRGEVNQLLSKLEYNNVKRFVDEEGTQLTKYGLKKPHYQVDLFLGKDLARKTLYVSRAIDGHYYARDESRKPIFELDTVVVKEINKKMKQFRSKDFAEFPRDVITKIVISYPDTTIICQKDSLQNWVLGDGTNRKLKKMKIDEFFTNLDFSFVKGFVQDGNINPRKYGFDKPSLNIKLYEFDRLLYEATFGKRVGENYYARNNRYESVYLIDWLKFKELKLNLDKILEKEKPKKEAKQEEKPKST